MIQVFTVVGQVALASILEIYHGYGFDSRFIPGSSARYLFRVLFSTVNGDEEKEFLEEGFTE